VAHPEGYGSIVTDGRHLVAVCRAVTAGFQRWWSWAKRDGASLAHFLIRMAGRPLRRGHSSYPVWLHHSPLGNAPSASTLLKTPQEVKHTCRTSPNKH
jgi:hypothetical protein